MYFVWPGTSTLQFDKKCNRIWKCAKATKNVEKWRNRVYWEQTKSGKQNFGTKTKIRRKTVCRLNTKVQRIHALGHVTYLYRSVHNCIVTTWTKTVATKMAENLQSKWWHSKALWNVDNKLNVELKVTGQTCKVLPPFFWRRVL